MVDRILKHLEIKKGTKAQFDALPVKSPDALYFITDSCSSGRNVGDIFYTTRNDTALNGSVECNGGTYSTADYTGAESIGELLAGGKLDYISLSDYATAISTKGWCDKIGWDGTGTTTVRVPTLTPHIIQKNNIAVVGNGMTLGLTNGSANFAHKASGYDYTGLYGQNVGSTLDTGSITTGGVGITTDGTKSGIIADTTDTAQLRVMFQLFTGTTDEAVATVGTVVAQVMELNSHRVVDFQMPTAGNGYTWYRKYADGWVEQGGIATISTNALFTVTFPIIMQTKPQAIATPYNQPTSSTGDYNYICTLVNIETSSLQIRYYDSDTSAWRQGDVCWEVKGIAA